MVLPGGLTPVGSIDHITSGTDVVVIAAAGRRLVDIVDRCGARDIGGVIVVSADGFDGDPAAAAALENEVMRVARGHGMRLVGPDCPFVVNTDPTHPVAVALEELEPLTGSVAAVTESGAPGVAFVEIASRSGMGLSTFLAVGRRPDVGVPDLLSFWADDDATAAVLLAVSGRGLTPRFVQAARAVSLTKPVATLATMLGGSPASDRSIDGSGRSAEAEAGRLAAMLRQTGLIAVDTVDQLVDIGTIVDRQGVPRGRGVAVVGDQAGPVQVAADTCVRAGLRLAPLAVTTEAGDRVENPFDRMAGVTLRDLENVLDTAASSSEVDSVIVLRTALGSTSDDTALLEFAAVVERVSSAHADTVFAVAMYDPASTSLPSADGPDGAIPVFTFAADAARALGHLAGHAEWRTLARVQGDHGPTGCDVGSAATVVARALGDRLTDPVELTHRQQEELLSAFGVSVVPRRTVTSAAEAVEAAGDVGFPVVLKGAVRDRSKRSVRSGVSVDIVDTEALEDRWAQMTVALGDAMVPAVVQQMVERGVDVAVRLRRDDAGGGTVEVGLGGPCHDVRPVACGSVAAHARRCLGVGRRLGRRAGALRSARPGPPGDAGVPAGRPRGPDRRDPAARRQSGALFGGGGMGGRRRDPRRFPGRG